MGGNSAARWKHLQESARLWRRAGVLLRTEAADLGNRRGLEEALGFGDARSFEGTSERFRWLSARWFAR